MRLFLDLNVVLDVIVPRENSDWNEDAQRVLDLAEYGFELGMAAMSVPTLAYVIKGSTSQRKKEVIREITRIIQVHSTTPEQVENALSGPFVDIEDAMQSYCAKDNGYDVIVTRNLKDFKYSDVPAISPSDLLDKISI